MVTENTDGHIREREAKQKKKWAHTFTHKTESNSHLVLVIKKFQGITIVATINAPSFDCVCFELIESESYLVVEWLPYLILGEDWWWHHVLL